MAEQVDAALRAACQSVANGLGWPYDRPGERRERILVDMDAILRQALKEVAQSALASDDCRAYLQALVQACS